MTYWWVSSILVSELFQIHFAAMGINAQFQKDSSIMHNNFNYNSRKLKKFLRPEGFKLRDLHCISYMMTCETENILGAQKLLIVQAFQLISHKRIKGRLWARLRQHRECQVLSKESIITIECWGLPYCNAECMFRPPLIGWDQNVKI